MVRWLSKAANSTSTRWRTLTKKVAMPAPFLAVTSFALVFGLMSFIQLPCPTCGGTGVITSSSGLKAELISATIIDSYIPLTCCDHPQVQYDYDVQLSVENLSSSPISGTVSISIFDLEPPLSGDDTIPAAAVSVTPVQVEVPVGKTVIVDQQINFIDIANILNQPHKVTVQSGDTATQDKCPLCKGKGKLQFYVWLETRVK